MVIKGEEIETAGATKVVVVEEEEEVAEGDHLAAQDSQRLQLNPKDRSC